MELKEVTVRVRGAMSTRRCTPETAGTEEGGEKELGASLSNELVKSVASRGSGSGVRL